jgi:type III secretion HrpO family protein
MTRALILDLTAQTMILVLVLSLPPIITATLTGLLVSVLQALTQIQEQTLSFAVKLIVVTITLLLTSYWIGGELINFTLRILTLLPYLDR